MKCLNMLAQLYVLGKTRVYTMKATLSLFQCPFDATDFNQWILDS